MRQMLINSYLPIAWSMAVLVLFGLVRFLPFSRALNKDIAEGQEVSAAAANCNDEPQPIWRDLVPDRMVVQTLEQGKATVFIRERSRLGSCTGHMIVWAGKRRKGRKIMVEDSHYDLGYLEGATLDDMKIYSFREAAKEKLAQLVAEGMEKQRRKKAAKQTESVVSGEEIDQPVVTGEASMVEVAKPSEPSNVVIEENAKPEPAIKVKRFPSVFRGTVLEMGMLPKSGRDGDFMCYGVRYLTPEGVEDIVWGVNLRTAFSDAKAKVGDEVEILKIGRKTVDEGKAPMNMYQVKKLEHHAVQ